MESCHYSDVIIGAMASQITSLKIVYSTVYSGADQRKHESSAWLAFVRGIHRWPVNSPHKGPVTSKMFQFDEVIMSYIYPYSLGLLHWHTGNHMIIIVPVKQLLIIWIKLPCSQSKENTAYVHMFTCIIFGIYFIFVGGYDIFQSIYTCSWSSLLLSAYFYMETFHVWIMILVQLYSVPCLKNGFRTYSKIKCIQGMVGLVQERRNSIANALELRFSCTNPSIYSSCRLFQTFDKLTAIMRLNGCQVACIEFSFLPWPLETWI